MGIKKLEDANGKFVVEVDDTGKPLTFLEGNLNKVKKSIDDEGDVEIPVEDTIALLLVGGSPLVEVGVLLLVAAALPVSIASVFTPLITFIESDLNRKATLTLVLLQPYTQFSLH